MKNRGIIALLTPLLLSCATFATNTSPPQQVLLQGSSSTELMKLVYDAGGTVTHDLHIINAVGAILSPDQLAQVTASPLILRTIDDLADIDDRDDSDADPEPPCRVRGHIELDIGPEGILWRLYNKQSKPATFKTLTLDWPASLGNVRSIKLGDRTLSTTDARTGKSNSLSFNFTDSDAPVIASQSELVASFANPIPAHGVNKTRQSDFNIGVSFEAGCSDKLAPAYANNHEDFSYNRVSGVEALHQQGVTGKGVTVAVIDSGLYEAPVLANDTQGNARIIGRYNAILDQSGEQVVDESGHGTHMTSIIAHSGKTLRNGKPTGSYKGVAPDVNLVAVRILDREGFAHILEIVQGVQWVVDNRERLNIRVLNLSFSRNPGWPYWEDPVNQAVMRAWHAGITVVAAAGNDGPEEGSIDSPGNLPYIITIGAVTDSWTPHTRDDDYIPDFSARGPTDSGHIKPDLVTLGGHMTGVIAPQSAMALEQPEDTLRTGEFVSTGSSQAAAFASGVVALLLQLEPNLSPDEVKCKLSSSAQLAINRDGTLAYSPFQQGFGYLDPIRAITLGDRDCGKTDWNIEADIAGDQHFMGPAIVGKGGTASLPGLEEMLSPTPSEKGLSETRKWGVKDHIEREDNSAPNGPDQPPSIDWHSLYLAEKARIEELAKHPPQ
jgi:serine protease AprX